MVKNPAIKGFDFEIDQAKKFSLWVTGGEDKDVFWRTSMSGGRASQKLVEGVHYGDLGMIKPHPQAIVFLRAFCVEFKRYKSLDLLAGFLNEKSDLRKWWFKTEVEAKENKVRPLLIVKPDYRDAVVFFDMYTGGMISLKTECDFFMISTKSKFNVCGVRQKELFETPWAFLEIFLRDYPRVEG